MPELNEPIVQGGVIVGRWERGPGGGLVPVYNDAHVKKMDERLASLTTKPVRQNVTSKKSRKTLRKRIVKPRRILSPRMQPHDPGDEFCIDCGGRWHKPGRHMFY